MDFKIDAFPVDDTQNGIRSTEKIRILICYIMTSVRTPLSRTVIQSILYDNGIANYFEISQAIDNLIRVGAIDSESSEGEELFKINFNGEKIAKELENELSVFIKNKAVRAANLTLIYEKRKRENDIAITRLSDKRYRLDITMHSGTTKNDDDLLKVSVFVTDSIQAEAMKKSFINNPVKLYEKVIEGLTDNPEFVG